MSGVACHVPVEALSDAMRDMHRTIALQCRRMTALGRALAVAWLSLACASLAQAQAEAFLEVDTGRTMSAAGGVVPVVMPAILTRPAMPTDTALLFFRGNPGYMLARSIADKRRNLGWIARGNAEAILLQAGVALVQVDCPTDEWGTSRQPPATGCFNDYRRSVQHADDVRRVMARLREQHALSRFFILGHSLGTVSSRWLAINLGRDEIAGSIHSAAINSDYPRGFLYSLMGNLSGEFPRRAAGAPMLHVHNEQDACPSTPYTYVRDYAKDNLVTVRGGIPDGDPCGGTHLHSYMGREAHAMQAIVAWIKSGRVERVAGD